MNHFNDVPPAFYRLLTELLQEVQAERDRERGAKRLGRRPALAAGTMRDVNDLAYPRRSELPFAAALREATTQTPSTIATLAGMNPGTLHRLMTGARPLTKAKIEAVARAIHISPAYFHEYRVLVVHEAIDGLLSPHRSLRAFAQIEAAHYDHPAPPTPNAPGGFAASARNSKTIAISAKRGE